MHHATYTCDLCASQSGRSWIGIVPPSLPTALLRIAGMSDQQYINKYDKNTPLLVYYTHTLHVSPVCSHTVVHSQMTAFKQARYVFHAPQIPPTNKSGGRTQNENRS